MPNTSRRIRTFHCRRPVRMKDTCSSCPMLPMCSWCCCSCGCGSGSRSHPGTRVIPSPSRPRRTRCSLRRTHRRRTTRPSRTFHRRCGCGCESPCRTRRTPRRSSPWRRWCTHPLRCRPTRPKCRSRRRYAPARRSVHKGRPSPHRPSGSCRRRCRCLRLARCRRRRPDAASRSACTRPCAARLRRCSRSRSGRCTPPNDHRGSARPLRCRRSCMASPPFGRRSRSRRRSPRPKGHRRHRRRSRARSLRLRRRTRRGTQDRS